MFLFFRNLMLGFLVLPTSAVASGTSLPGHELSILWSVPFAGILLTLSLAPLAIPKIWHSYYGRLSLGWALAALIPMTLFYGVEVMLYETLHTYLLHFIPFIILIGALYTISGGVKIDLHFPATPTTNTLLLLIASLIASLIGTTGAAMLFIRPLLVINKDRTYKTHTVIFFILLVCNIGGALTALGDPPLFLGFLNGIDFFWPTKALFLPFVLVSVPLLITYFVIDSIFAQKDINIRNSLQKSSTCLDKPETKSFKRLKLSGKRNLIFLAVAIASVLLSGLWKSTFSFSIFGISVGLESLTRDGLLLLMSWCSWTFGSKAARQDNHFTWEPLLEVARLFAAIFITAAPVIAILKAGENGSFKALMEMVTIDGAPANAMYFWLTGTLSAFLDNAPTYLVFFNMAGGDPAVLMGPLSQTLAALSTGAVFMGALTYIGNAPNFMVKSIAESKDVTMPGFFGYMIWSCGLLLPLFLILTFVLF